MTGRGVMGRGMMGKVGPGPEPVWVERDDGVFTTRIPGAMVRHAIFLWANPWTTSTPAYASRCARKSTGFVPGREHRSALPWGGAGPGLVLIGPR
jgi:hypothetical protein